MGEPFPSDRDPYRIPADFPFTQEEFTGVPDRSQEDLEYVEVAFSRTISHLIDKASDDKRSVEIKIIDDMPVIRTRVELATSDGRTVTVTRDVDDFEATVCDTIVIPWAKSNEIYPPGISTYDINYLYPEEGMVRRLNEHGMPALGEGETGAAFNSVLFAGSEELEAGFNDQPISPLEAIALQRYLAPELSRSEST
jgi:hypothetical protein